MLHGKNVVLGVTGGIAAYKAVELVRLLTKAGATVDVIMTQNATEFVGPITFQTVTGRPVHVGTFKLLETSDISHTSLSERADLFIVAPATANLIGKYAAGIADDLLTTTLLATTAPVLLAPAMNPRMWDHPATVANMQLLTERGVAHIGPEPGEVACKDIGYGRMSEPRDIVETALMLVAPKPLRGRRMVISAGPTRERLDPVRYLSNRSSGKMGFALARAAAMLGARVTLVAGPVNLPTPPDVERVDVESAEEMFEAVREAFDGADVLIMAAAVADFRPAAFRGEKLPKDEVGGPLEMARNADIVATLAAEKGARRVIGFAAETGDAIAKARAKMGRKGLDAIVANDVAAPGIGFDTDDNEVHVLFADGRDAPLPRGPKQELAFSLLEALFAADDD
jgi:phosphopantothenoylcysteine decarboxylase / phosphopantothenate---cysteine ligase